MQAVATPIDSLITFIEQRIAELGKSRRQVAEDSGLDPGTLTNIMIGRVTKAPSIGTLEKLAKGLRVPPERLIAIARGESTPALVLSERPASETGKYPVAQPERALLDEADARGIVVDTFNTPGFWDRPYDDELREDAFHHLRRMIQIDKRIKGA